MRNQLHEFESTLTSWIEQGPYASPQATLLKGQAFRQEPTAKQILKLLDPSLAGFALGAAGGKYDALANTQRGRGVLADRAEWAKRLVPDAPVLPADQFHPWVWGAAYEHDEWEEQIALEALAAFSILARWISEWDLVTSE